MVERRGIERGSTLEKRTGRPCSAHLLPALVLMIALLAGGAWGATISARVVAETVGIDDLAVLEVKVASGSTGALATPRLPKLDGWSVVSTGSSRNMSFVSGRLETSLTYTFKLRPLRIGELTIPAIGVAMGDEKLATDPISVTVKEGSIVGGQQPGQRSVFDGPFGRDPYSRRRTRSREREIDPYEHAEVETLVDRDEAIVGEQITLTFRLATSPYIRFDRQPLYTAPEVEGAWVEALGEQATRAEIRAGVEWELLEIHYALFPTKPGPIEVGPAKLDGVINAGSMDIFSMMRRTGRRLLLESEPIGIIARPLPDEGRPADFKGAVGAYRVRAEFDREQGTANDPLTLTIEVSGHGNLNTVPEPDLPEVEGLRFFEPQSEVVLVPRGKSLTGRRVFTRLVVPEVAGSVIFPELGLSFYDPAQSRYRTVHTSAVRLEILPDDSMTEGGPIVSGLSKEEVKRLESEIEYIRTEVGSIVHQGARGYRETGFWALAALPLVVIAGAVVLRRRKHRLATDSGYARSSRAMKRLEPRLEELRSVPRGSGEAWAFASRILLDYLGDKLNLNAAGLTTEETMEVLRASELPGEVVADIREFLTSCDLARYASASIDESTGSLIERVRSISRRIEKPEGSARGKQRAEAGGRRL